MASRQMRRSGLSSPKGRSTQDPTPNKFKERPQGTVSADSNVWEEPPLRTPVPSFEDYKGLERHGVLEHMAPLGSLPGSKVKARLRQHEPPRRAAHLKTGEVGETRAVRDEVSTPEPAPPVTTKRSVPRNEEHPQQAPSSREHGEDSENCTIDLPKVTPTQKSPTRPTTASPQTSQMSVAQIRWKRIIDSAVKRASDLGNPELGLAIRKLYDESTQNQVLAELLDAVLSQRATEQQAAAFQVYIRAARKQLKKSKAHTRRTTPSVSKSSAKTLRSHATRQLETSKSTDLPDITHRPSTSIEISSKSPADQMAANGSPFKDGRPSKRVKRSNSASSDSSLSSLDSDIEDFAPDKVESTLSKTTNNVPPQRSRGAPGIGPRLGSFATDHAQEGSRPPLPNDTPEARIAARRRLQQMHGYHDHTVTDSSVRSPPSLPPQATLPLTALQQRCQQPRRNGFAHRSRRYDEDAPDSPASSQGDLLIPSLTGVQSATPNNLGRPPKAVKKAARVKQSPLKKRNGVTAGIARAAEPEHTHVGNGRNDDSSSEHADICSACSGNGTLLLCEDCPRAYHFTCCDPPLDPNKELSGEWRCWHCADIDPHVDEDIQESGIWTMLKENIKYKNPSSFHLPKDLRDYFEGVAAGDEGEYEELPNAKLTKARLGYEEQPDNFRLKDRKDNTILCFRCGGSSMGKREIVACDFCILHWHLDCLDPPLASAPNKKLANGKPRQTWMCPNHVDQELAHLKASATPAGKAAIQRSASIKPQEYRNSRSFRTRRPKKAKVVEIGLRRGFRNNGMIEIVEEHSEEESEIEKEISGVVYRVPEKGIKLDFIDRVKRSRLEAAAFTERAPPVQRRRKSNHIQTAKSDVTSAQIQRAELDKRPFIERKAALNLAQLAQADVELSSDKVANLIDTLTAEAPKNVQALLAGEEKKGAALGPVSEQEKKDLEALIALARRRLGSQ